MMNVRPDERQQPWRLNSFLDSLILELDRAQDTLAVKGINRRLTYTVKDLALDLQLFPHFDGRELRFLTAKPGENGAARVTFQLGSITDRQIREVTTAPLTEDDIAIDLIDDIDEETKSTLERMGVKSGKDLERMRDRNVDLKQASDNRVDYNRLAGIINRARRRGARPAVFGASLTTGGAGAPELRLEGENLAAPTPALALAASGGAYPLAFLNGEPVTVTSATERELTMAVPEELVRDGANALCVVLDPHAVVTVDLTSDEVQQ
jgi:hypothetical protein